MLLYAALRCSMLLYAALRCSMLIYAALRFATLRYFTLLYNIDFSILFIIGVRAERAWRMLRLFLLNHVPTIIVDAVLVVLRKNQRLLNSRKN
jgi:hypothetical protein